MALEKILAAKRRRLAAEPLPVYSPSPRAGDGLVEALRRPGPAFILECKAASPSGGTMIADYNPATLAAAYDGFADAISVLTEPEFFGGDITHLERVRGAVATPILRKDFILGPEEVREARAHGADAVLLMLSVLDGAGWRACFEQCAALGMDALTEVHDEAELERALALGAPLIGLNNRNLKTLEVDLAVTEELVPRIPADRLVVSESGIAEHADVQRLAPWVDGFLVGNRLNRSGRPAHAARELVCGRFKVCGLTRAEDAVAAWCAGAVMGGLIFAPDSSRRINVATARCMQAAAPLDWVGVFRNQSVEEVAELAEVLRLSMVQLHGTESKAYVRDLRGKLSANCAIWKAVPARKPLPSRKEFGVDRLLLDTGRHGKLGGSGVAFDPAEFAHVDLSDCILAGGLTPENASRAARLGGWALDVNSGVESAPGVKDVTRLQMLGEALRRAPGKRAHDCECTTRRTIRDM